MSNTFVTELYETDRACKFLWTIVKDQKNCDATICKQDRYGRAVPDGAPHYFWCFYPSFKICRIGPASHSAVPVYFNLYISQQRAPSLPEIFSRTTGNCREATCKGLCFK